ncbi:TIGR04282 family arsenosugar biosynthesis glycosyltransferase [cf. Phormidesmis sp. LEGE 11477]|uniref:TIGR04282 family arsenosugar biosynthesis glycosyltransferase n=1 Tax=cf. Phormidesmis sp. LEGE 11477 TaxID=1828680 RepID=UPI00187E121D|nr:TIGR04282 family arsenosugar biosynthesis glycosyltransferase [cf. Phormidesmis sp. LEGE 11477]MBE9061438.1 TIGR04282 family arsenosugar biosynthesis glycosyltransferase [cf. Phormidesmis sp. LEGE 11477]
MPPSHRLLLFLRYPQPGQTKTRLIPALGAVGAAQLQRQMAEYLLAKLDHPAWQLQIHFTGASLRDMQSWLGSGYAYKPQIEGNLGEKLWSGFQSTFAEENPALSSQNRVVAVGADCPDLSVRHIRQAFEHLDYDDVVLGPALDGGYYLIGLRQSCLPSKSFSSSPTSSALPPDSLSQKSLFTDISWSTSAVLRQTLESAKALDLSTAQLETLADIDRPSDLAIWHRLQTDAYQANPKHSSNSLSTDRVYFS